MANDPERLRITELSTEYLAINDGDYVLVDSFANGAGKFNMNRLKANMADISYDSGTKTLTITIGGT